MDKNREVSRSKANKGKAVRLVRPSQIVIDKSERPRIKDRVSSSVRACQLEADDARECINQDFHQVEVERLPKYVFKFDEDETHVVCAYCASIITKQFMNYIRADD